MDFQNHSIIMEEEPNSSHHLSIIQSYCNEINKNASKSVKIPKPLPVIPIASLSLQINNDASNVAKNNDQYLSEDTVVEQLSEQDEKITSKALLPHWNKQILIVDDEAFNQDACKTILRAALNIPPTDLQNCCQTAYNG